MVVVPSSRASSRGKAAVSAGVEQYPKGIIQLMYVTFKDDKATNNCIRILGCLIIGCCVVLYTVVAAMKGVHGLTLPVLVPGGVVGGTSLTYYIIRLIVWLRNRGGDDATADMQPTQNSADLNRKPARQ
jgi:hypothetical protein